jgi:hypothetical protein
MKRTDQNPTTMGADAALAEPREMQAMARRAWQERGIVILWPEHIPDECDRRHVLNVAAALYGARKAVRP